ncbi:peptide deformylase [Clostridium algidicarnis]|uniref:Peptide deformylase n=2 Tax=Clostridium algidicarnis TaxID=37659 RepID=A0A2S6G192_9CLOT|nr:peptide deformylase [Clostridium algidicarnis]MBB6631162.1 peptide deformylase [Clostridium algidicarnis]MBU3203194.1 peptide deformylase [Clostridium algidicarnis]MBU3211348.1 peptide deformylase [Clostridium algidicarnis]MBU3218730.1 peptide deformylase [Clostridium algidicarnis]MBU3222144.1 peptide deformylase [Clostridium algidicarnis]
MALRNIRIYGDPILRKKSKPVEVVNDRIKILIKDMFQTMYYEDGVGLAAPQVGILKRVVVVDIGEGPIALINPEIISKEGSYIDTEGCLSLPEKQGEVERPQHIKVKALNEEGKEINFDAEDLFARAICHEVDHLDGILFTDKVIPEEE